MLVFFFFFSRILTTLTEVLGRDIRANDPRMSAGCPSPKLPLWADFAFLKSGSVMLLWGISGLGGVETPVYGDCIRNTIENFSGFWMRRALQPILSILVHTPSRKSLSCDTTITATSSKLPEDRYFSSHRIAFKTFGRREKTPTPKTRFSIWSLLRTPSRFTTRPLPVHFTTKMSVVRPFSLLSKDEIGP